MANNIDKMHLHILRLIHMLEQESNNDVSLKYLLAVAKKDLKNLDRDSWSRRVNETTISIEDHFYESETFTFTNRERLILFLIFNRCLDKIDDNLLEIINYFADAFLITNVNPLNYSLYLQMLTHPSILKLLIEADPADLIYLLTSIIEHVSIEDLNFGSYEGALKILCKVVNFQAYSPFFFGDYSIQNVYKTVKQIANNEDYNHFVSSKDKAKLEFLSEMDSIATETFRDSFKSKMIELEKRFEYKKIGLVLAIAKLAPSLLFEARTSHYENQNDNASGGLTLV